MSSLKKIENNFKETLFLSDSQLCFRASLAVAKAGLILPAHIGSL